MNLEQLEKEERELMKRLAEIRKMKMKLKPKKTKKCTQSQSKDDVSSFLNMANAIIESRRKASK